MIRRIFSCALGACICVAFVGACSNDAAPNNGQSTCTTPGEPRPGKPDTHCGASDAGPAMIQPTSMASCHPDAAPPGPVTCPYGDTMFGGGVGDAGTVQESDDDDCKYHVKWTAGSLCEGSGGVAFTVVATNKVDGTPLTGASTGAETFTTSPADAGCDNQSNHPGPNSGVVLVEGPPGTYKGNVQFDKPGAWTIRFHFHEECEDLLPDSPHGHAAYFLTLP